MVDRARDRRQSLRAVVDGVATGRDGQQHLGCADVGCGPLPPDVLLAGLQGEPESSHAVGVPAHSDHASGKLAFEPGADGDEAGVRAAVEQRDAEALRRTDRDVGPPRRRRTDQGECEQVDGRDQQGVVGVSEPSQLDQIGGGRQHPVGTGHLHHDSERPDGCGRLRRDRRPPRRLRRRWPGSGSAVRRGSAAAVPDRPRRSPPCGTRGAPRPPPRPPRCPRPAGWRRTPAARSGRSTIVWKLASASSRPWLISGW